MHESETASRPHPVARSYADIGCAPTSRAAKATRRVARQLLDGLDPDCRAACASALLGAGISRQRESNSRRRPRTAALMTAMGRPARAQRAQLLARCAPRSSRPLATLDAKEMNDVIDGTDRLETCLPDRLRRRPRHAAGRHGPESFASWSAQEAALRPVRWRPVLRRAMELGDSRTARCGRRCSRRDRRGGGRASPSGVRA